MELAVSLKVGTVKITDDMVVNPGDYIPEGEYNPHHVRPFVIGHEFGPFAVVFADCDQHAIDEAIDSGKMDFLQVKGDELEQMTEEERDELLCGGNAGEYFRQDYLWMDELTNPAFSFVALLSQGQPL